MTIIETLTTILSSVGVTAAGAWYLAKKLLDHRLAVERKNAELLLSQRLEKEKLSWHAEVRKDVESYLADSAAEREYVLEARKRLYVAIGPLRFQLLLACRDVVGRLVTHSQHGYEMDLGGYYGKSTLYRLLRPIAISSLIEQQVAFADFSVDPSAVALLRFSQAARSALSDAEPIVGHPSANWKYQEQHIFVNNVTLAASVLIDTNSERLAPIEYADFEQRLNDQQFQSHLTNIPTILKEFSIIAKPLLWARLVCYGYLCNRYLEQTGEKIGFSARSYDATGLLAMTQDKYFDEHLVEFEAACRTLYEAPL